MNENIEDMNYDSKVSLNPLQIQPFYELSLSFQNSCLFT